LLPTMCMRPSSCCLAGGDKDEQALFSVDKHHFDRKIITGLSTATFDWTSSRGGILAIWL